MSDDVKIEGIEHITIGELRSFIATATLMNCLQMPENSQESLRELAVLGSNVWIGSVIESELFPKETHACISTNENYTDIGFLAYLLETCSKKIDVPEGGVPGCDKDAVLTYMEWIDGRQTVSDELGAFLERQHQLYMTCKDSTEFGRTMANIETVLSTGVSESQARNLFGVMSDASCPLVALSSALNAVNTSANVAAEVVTSSTEEGNAEDGTSWSTIRRFYGIDDIENKGEGSAKGYGDFNMSDALVALGLAGTVGGLAYGAYKLFSSKS